MQKQKKYINNLVKKKLNINLIIEIGIFLHPQNIESLNFIHANIFFILLDTKTRWGLRSLIIRWMD